MGVECVLIACVLDVCGASTTCPTFSESFHCVLGTGDEIPVRSGRGPSAGLPTIFKFFKLSWVWH